LTTVEASEKFEKFATNINKDEAIDHRSTDKDEEIGTDPHTAPATTRGTDSNEPSATPRNTKQAATTDRSTDTSTKLSSDDRSEHRHVDQIKQRQQIGRASSDTSNKNKTPSIDSSATPPSQTDNDRTEQSTKSP
jgi:hypothetical protein